MAAHPLEAVNIQISRKNATGSSFAIAQKDQRRIDTKHSESKIPNINIKLAIRFIVTFLAVQVKGQQPTAFTSERRWETSFQRFR